MSSTGNSPLRAQAEPIVRRLAGCRQRILAARETGRVIADERDDDEQEMLSWNQSLPPIAFEIARETKDLVVKVDALDGAGGGPMSSGLDEDFS